MNRKAIAGWVLGAIGCGLLAYVWLTPDRPAHAATAHVYVMNSGPGAPYIYVLNPTTMAVTDTLTNLSSTQGRGVVAIGGTIYYTTLSSNSVYSYTLGSHTNNGAVFTLPGSMGVSDLAFDGTNFWIAPNGTKNVYKYSLTGTLLQTVTLTNASLSPGFSGFDYFTAGGQGRLIANRSNSSGTYDIYDLSGNVLSSAFIVTGGIIPNTATGITFDGTNFLVSSPLGSIDTYSGTTGALIQSTTITGYGEGFAPSLEDLSIDNAAPTPPPGVPTLSQWGLILCGLLLLGAGIRMTRKPVAA